MQLLSRFRRPEPFAWVFLLFSVVLLCTLGTWQVQRLTWKEGLIAQTLAVKNAAPLTSLPANKEQLEALHFRQVLLKGQFDHDHLIYRVGRRPGFPEGYYILTPFVMEDGKAVIVNRGFAPGKQEYVGSSIQKPEGTINLEGMLRPPRQQKYFSPPNDTVRNMWFYDDFPAMEAVTEHTLLPVIVDTIGEYEEDVFPIPGDGDVRFRNDHLGYAITWYSLALVAVVMFAIYFRKQKDA